MIGRRFTELSDDDINRWPFEVVDDKNRPKLNVHYKGTEMKFKPEEISAHILKKLKSSAEKYLNAEVESAVITVPAYFTDSQRQATMDAAGIAGLQVLQLLNEPTAAAVAYGLQEKLNINQTVLVFDMGGGTFDVSILETDGKLFEVKAVGGDAHLGGEDFNNKLLDYFVREIDEKLSLDVSSDKTAISRLLKQCEKAKINLSTSEVADIKIKSLFKKIDFESTITRARFEELNAEAFEKAIKIVEETLLDAEMSVEDIDEVILVGGSTFIPKVQTMLQEFFDGKQLNKKVKPDEAVAYGAAVLASVLSGEQADDFEMVLLDVTPISLGTDLKDGKMNVIIKKNTPIPTEVSQLYTTVTDNQSRMEVGVYEGENEDIKDNKVLGNFCLTEIPPAKAGEPQIKVTMQINADGILKVSAINTMNDEEKSITIQEYEKRFNADDSDDSDE